MGNQTMYKNKNEFLQKNVLLSRYKSRYSIQKTNYIKV